VALILRVAGRWSAWEGGDPGEIVEYEFRAQQGGPDLRPSVYEIADETPEIVQVLAEHSAGSNSLRKMRGIDLTGAFQRDPAPAPGELPFAFTRDAHRELILESQDELVEIVRRVLPALEVRTRAAEKRDIKAYVASRVAAADPEWLKFFAEHRNRAQRYGVDLP